MLRGAEKVGAELSPLPRSVDSDVNDLHTFHTTERGAWDPAVSSAGTQEPLAICNSTVTAVPVLEPRPSSTEL